MGFPKGYGRAEILNDSLLDPLGSSTGGVEYISTVTTVVEENARDIAGVRLVVNVNIPLDGSLATIQGVTLSNGDVVVPVAQASQAENGPYIVSVGNAWGRLSSDPEEWRIIHCREGENAGTLYELVTTGTITLGTTPLLFRPVRAVPCSNSVTTETIADGNVTPEKLSFDPATQGEVDTAIAGHAATQGSPFTSGHVKPDGVTLIDNGNGQLQVAGATSLQNVQVQRNGVAIGERAIVNFIQGGNITLTTALNGPAIDVTIAGAAGGVVGSGTANRVPQFTSATALGDSRISIATATAMVEIPYISGDAQTTLRVGDSNNGANFKTAIEGYTYGGYGGRFFSWVNHAVYAEAANSGRVALYGYNSGGGTGVQGDAGDSGTGVRGVTQSGEGVRGTSTTGKAVRGVTTNGYGGDFETGTGRAINANVTGNGYLFYGYRNVSGASFDAFTLILDNPADNGSAMYVRHDGTGEVAAFDQQNASSVNTCVRVVGRGSGSALSVAQQGTGKGIYLSQTGSGKGLDVLINSAFNNNDAGAFETNGTARAVYGRITNAGSTADVAFLETTGQGNSLKLSLTNTAASTTTTNNFLIGIYNSVRKWRVDKDGKGFFGNGTQVGGQDYAELMRVEGGRMEGLEPGDLLVISALEDCAVALCQDVESLDVAGVYSTKPGVLGVDLCAGDVTAEAFRGMIPVAFVGLVPLKVCDEGGSVRRRDWLVASSIPGHAMKAPDGADPRSYIGRAHEEFTRSGRGVITARINIK